MIKLNISDIELEFDSELLDKAISGEEPGGFRLVLPNEKEIRGQIPLSFLTKSQTKGDAFVNGFRTAFQYFQKQISNRSNE